MGMLLNGLCGDGHMIHGLGNRRLDLGLSDGLLDHGFLRMDHMAKVGDVAADAEDQRRGRSRSD